jgi:hypothetical protein
LINVSAAMTAIPPFLTTATVVTFSILIRRALPGRPLTVPQFRRDAHCQRIQNG